MESCRVAHGEGDGVSFGADGLDEGAVFGPNAVMSLENHGSSRLDEERVPNADVACHEDGVSFPNAILIAIYFNVLRLCK